jgi:hypothetical protein
MACGRIRKLMESGWNQLIDKELDILKVNALLLSEGETYMLKSGDREYGCVLIYGECGVEIKGDAN